MSRMRLTRTPQAPQQVAGPQLRAAFDAVLAELELDGEFPTEVLAAAERAAAAGSPASDLDLTDLAFVTIDPAGSMDLDQAMCLQRNGSGFRVHYAIADVAAFVRPGTPIDEEARRRGQTLYTPTRRIPLHPPALSEGAASLLPEQSRPAMVWQIDVDDTGATTAATVRRALVRSRARFTYAEVQAGFDAGNPPPEFELLQPLGELLVAGEVARGGAGLKVPDQEIVETDAGYDLVYRPVVGVEQWNAQISLLTGRAAADLMIDGRVGILRTMPAPDANTIDRLRRQSLALGVAWPADLGYQGWLDRLDVTDPKQLALSHESAILFRGAGYVAFDGEAPAERIQAAVGDEYAHVTAPLRRLVDRFGLEICAALCVGADVPGWVREALPTLPDIMKASDQRAGALERACIDLAEAALLSGRVGEQFTGVVVDVRSPGGKGKNNKNQPGDGAAETAPNRGLVQLQEPAVLAAIDGAVTLGEQVQATLVEADVVKRSVRFQLA